MAQKPDLYAPRRPVPAKPVTQSFPTPNLADRVLVVHKDSRTGEYRLPKKGDAFTGPDANKFKDFKFATAKPSDQIGWVDWFYLNERLNQDEYNFIIEYPWVDENYPRVTRTYVILRTDYVKPSPDATDPKNEELSLVDVKNNRLEDEVLDALFVGVTKVFERVPAPVAYGINRFDGILPYKFRVAVPERTVTTIKEGAAQPPELTKGDWGGSEKTDSFNRRTVQSNRRELPPGGVTFISEKLTRDKQVAQVTESWRDEIQHIEARPTLLEGEVEHIGDGTTIKSETEVESVFPETRHAAEILDPVPRKFQSLTPTRTFAETKAGQAQPPTLATGELQVVEDQKDTQIMRRSVVKRDPDKLPVTVRDYELGGIRTHGSEFGGTLETATTLDKKPQTVEEGFEIIASSVEDIGSGLTLKKVTRLHTGGTGTGPYLKLTDGGDSYVDTPAIVFDGDRGSGAEGTASISEVTGGQLELDAGGDFNLPFGSGGDNNGVFNFLGKRYNNGVWTNPALNGTIEITTKGAYSATLAQKALAVDQNTTASLVINPVPGGGNGITFDLGSGREVTPNRVAIRGPSDAAANAVKATKFEVWAWNTLGEDSDIVKVGGPFTLPAASAWADFVLTATKGYRYLRAVAAELEALDSSDLLYPAFYVPEIEFYGGLSIKPAADLRYSYNGDENGVFFYLGKRGGGGTWRNPQTHGDISVTAPYDTLELGTFDSIVDRESSNTYLAQRNHAELWFDLGVDRMLLLTNVLFRQRADYGSAMTVVYVQGSVDGVVWEENQRMTVDYRAASWTKIDITNFTKYYRFFRLILPADKGWLMIGELELYGDLRLAPVEVVTNYSVTGVTIINGGSNYAEPPDVTFSGGGGTGAAGVAVIEDGVVVGVTITNAGLEYTSSPDVTFSLPGTGSGATAESNISGGVVTSIDVVDPGAGYSQERPPVVKIVSATGTGAFATANVALDGTIDSITVDDGGTGYALPPTVVIYPDTDPEAVAVVGFPINGIVLTDGGENYTSPPAVHISGSGSEATATATLGFGVDFVQLTDGGDGYTSTPTVVLTGNGTGAAGTAIIGKVVASTTVTAGGSGYLTEPNVEVSAGNAQFRALIGRPILTIGLTNRGSGYTSNPTVTITGDGSGAAAHVVRSFAVASIAVSAGGSGYTTVPTVNITAPTGEFPVQATAHAVLTADAVTSIVIDNPGSGYLTAPTATLSGGDGAGATAGAATLESGGAINSIVVDTYGTNYTEATVALTGGGGSGATATIGLDTLTAGPIVKIQIENPGTDYTVAPTLTIVPGTSGGTGATATAALSTVGRVTGVTITNPGSGYSGLVTVGFTGGAGSGAAGTVVMEATGSVKSVTLVNPGTGFGDDTVITFLGGGGSGAEAEISSADCGEVIEIQLTKPGGPFTVPPTVQFVGGQSSFCEGGSGNGWSALPDLSTPRQLHTATLLSDGRVLVVGGTSESSYTGGLDTCEIFDPITNTWSSTGAMNYPRSTHAAVSLADGRVLVMGGNNLTGNPEDTSEIFDPITGVWSESGALITPDDGLAGYSTRAILLNDDRVLMIRGRQEAKSTQIFDPTSETWALTTPWPYNDADFAQWLHGLTLNLLPDGRVLAAFGRHVLISGDDYRGTAGIFDPDTELWSEPAGDMDIHWDNHTATTLADGKILFTAGFTDDLSIPVSQVYDPATELFTPTGAADSLKHFAREASLMVNGDVLSTGGDVVSGAIYSDTAEIWDVATGTASAIDPMINGRRWHTQTTLPDGRVMVVGGNSSSGVLAAVEVFGGVPTPATAIYHLGSSWPTLVEEHTDPTEGIITKITKKIVPVNTSLPEGFADSFPLDIYRSIHIVTKVDLHSLPAPEIYDTTQHVSFPSQLIACYPIWDVSRQQSTAGGSDTGTNRGAVSAQVSVHGSIVLTTINGFRGAAMGRVEREFFASLEAAKLATEGIEPTIIRPSSGTAILRNASNSATNEGLTYDQSPPLNIYGQPAQPGDPMPGGGTYAGSFNFASKAQSSGSTGTSTQVKDINDVLTAGFNSTSNFKATNSSSADVLTASAEAQGSFTLVIPASNPTIIVPGKAVLAQVVLEKWRFGLYVRHLIYLHAPVIE